MMVTLYTNTADVFKLDKTAALTQLRQTAFTATKQITMLEPRIDLDYAADILSANYCYIDIFNAWYFIEDKICDIGKKITLVCSIDPLYTFKDGILNCDVCCIRSESPGKPTDVPDSQYPVHPTKKLTEVIKLGTGIFKNDPAYPYFLTVQGT